MLNIHTARFISKIQLTRDVYLFRFGLVNPSALSFVAGQYMTLQIPQPDGTLARRFISIASGEEQTGGFEGVMKMLPNGVASSYLMHLSEGSELSFLGPAGKFNLVENDLPKVFLATGTGIGPIRSMLRRLQITRFPKPVHLMWGLPTFKDVYFLDEFKRLLREYPQFSFTICLSRDVSLSWEGEEDKKIFRQGRISSSSLQQYDNSFDFYICGARETVDSIRNVLLTQGIQKERIHFERFV